MTHIHKPLTHDWSLKMSNQYRLFENKTEQTNEYIILDAYNQPLLNFELYHDSMKITQTAWDTKFQIFHQEKKIVIYNIPNEEIAEGSFLLEDKTSETTKINSIKVEVGSDFIPFLFEKEKEEEVINGFESMRHECKQITGVEIPKVHICDNLSLPPKKIHITINDTVVFSEEDIILFRAFRSSIKAFCNYVASLIYNYLHSHS